MGAKRYGYFRSGEVFCMERRQYIPVGLTAASMRPTSRAPSMGAILEVKVLPRADHSERS